MLRMRLRNVDRNGDSKDEIDDEEEDKARTPGARDRKKKPADHRRSNRGCHREADEDGEQSCRSFARGDIGCDRPRDRDTRTARESLDEAHHQQDADRGRQCDTEAGDCSDHCRDDDDATSTVRISHRAEEQLADNNAYEIHRESQRNLRGRRIEFLGDLRERRQVDVHRGRRVGIQRREDHSENRHPPTGERRRHRNRRGRGRHVHPFLARSKYVKASPSWPFAGSHQWLPGNPGWSATVRPY